MPDTPESSIPPWMVVYVTHNPAEAHVIAGRLQSEGIKAWVHQEPSGSALGITVGLLGELRVLVNEPDYDAAMEILETPPHSLPEDVDQTIFEEEDFDAADFDDDDDE